MDSERIEQIKLIQFDDFDAMLDEMKGVYSESAKYKTSWHDIAAMIHANNILLIELIGQIALSRDNE